MWIWIKFKNSQRQMWWQGIKLFQWAANIQVNSWVKCMIFIKIITNHLLIITTLFILDKTISKIYLREPKECHWHKQLFDIIIAIGHFREIILRWRCRDMEDTKEVRETDYMTNEEYREELRRMFDSIDNNRILRYFCIFVSEKLKRVLWWHPGYSGGIMKRRDIIKYIIMYIMGILTYILIKAFGFV